MDITAASTLARQLMSQHKLSGWSFALNRGKSTLGLCRYTQRRIELSIYYTMANSEESVRDTLLHEIAHALAGPRAGHGPKWRAMCTKIGAKPQRCDREAVMPQGAWRATCGKCGHVYTRHRRPMRGRRYACGTCGPDAVVIKFQLVG